MINPFYLKSEINKLEHEDFSAKSYVKYLLMWYIGMLAMSYIFKLKWPYALFLVILETLFLPGVFYMQQKNKYDVQRFVDVASYIEQLLYSFKRQPKILSALKDTVMLFEDRAGGRLRRGIDSAIEYIQSGTSIENIYKEAFQPIEDEYGCKRLFKTHSFLIRVENAGGIPDDAINILLKDRNLWVSRIESLIHDKNKIRINVSIGIALSIVVIMMSTYMVPENFGIALMKASQIAKTITISLDFLIWYWVERSLSKSLLDADKDMPFEEIERSYNIVMHDTNKKKTRSFIIAALIIAVGGVAAFFAMGIKAAIVIELFAILIATQPKRQYKACFKRVKREVEKVFPDWMLSLALQMQTDNVHISIAKTTADSPQLMWEELDKLQDGIEKHPDDLNPYVGFFKKLQITDIITAMKMLYSMAEFGAEDSQEQIRGLVDRNTEIMDKAERMRIEDHLAGISFAMLTGVITMLTDLALVMGYILSQVQA